VEVPKEILHFKSALWLDKFLNIRNPNQDKVKITSTNLKFWHKIKLILSYEILKILALIRLQRKPFVYNLSNYMNLISNKDKNQTKNEKYLRNQVLANIIINLLSDQQREKISTKLPKKILLIRDQLVTEGNLREA